MLACVQRPSLQDKAGNNAQLGEQRSENGVSGGPGESILGPAGEVPIKFANTRVTTQILRYSLRWGIAGNVFH